MEKIVFTDLWERYFQRFGLSSFDDLYSLPETLLVNKNKKRNVLKFTLGEDGNRKTFFIKRFHDPYLKDMFAAACKFGFPTSQAHVEWKNAHHLLSNDIETYKPVCFGERTRMGIETKSFIVTEQLDSKCLLEFVIESWQLLGGTLQEKIIVAVAKLARRIHDLDISFPDLYLWHLFIRLDSLAADLQLSIIDLHRMSQGIRTSRRKIKELGRLHWSMSTDYFSDEHKSLFITAYRGNNLSLDTEALMKIVRKCSVDLDRKRPLSQYYRLDNANVCEAGCVSVQNI